MRILITLLLLLQSSYSLVNIELYIPGQETRCISEVFHPKENMLFQYNIENIKDKEISYAKDNNEGKINHYVKNSAQQELFNSDKNKDEFLHKVTESDK